jgi:hypothetical protein
MKATQVLIVRVARDDADEFWSIRAKDAIALLDLSPKDRWARFIVVAKNAKVHSTNEEDLYIDASGNRSDEEFWNDEDGEQAWAESLSQVK